MSTSPRVFQPEASNQPGASDLRCPNRKFGELLKPTLDDGVIEVACSSRFCGKRRGVAVRHTFNTRTGALINTRVFREPKGRDPQ